MANSLPHKIFPCLLLHFLFHFSFLNFCVADYELPPLYFINCGSDSTVTFYSRNFTGDMKNSPQITFSSKDSRGVGASTSAPAEQLYQTARIFSKPSTYELDIAENGTHVVRFHFFPFAALGNLSDARFSLEASNFRLLSNFSLQNDSVSDFPRIEEFLLAIPVGKFKIRFVPSNEINSFGFVNAIEVFLSPLKFVDDSAHDGLTADNNGLLSSPLRVVHRINVGGSNIMPNNDTLLRYWIPDDVYLADKAAAKNSVPYNGRVNYKSELASEFDAPNFVYNTAKELNTGDNASNILWRFDVKKGGKHLIRVHFCDIVSHTTNELLKFNLSIYTKLEQEIYPYDVVAQTAVPFYHDFLVDSDSSGFLNISISPEVTSDPRIAFLNGLEIMELVTELSPPSHEESDSTRRRLLIIIGACVGGVIVVSIFLSLLYLGMRKRRVKSGQSSQFPVVTLYGGSTHSKSKTTHTTASGSSHELNLGLRLSFSEILYATKNFDRKLVIGEGGFGKVYKAMLRNGTKVAVKRSERGHGQGFPEFQTEISLLSKIHHHHLVSLIGYCDESNEMILVYEFMEKGTLRDHLYFSEEESDLSKSRSELSWEERLRICIGAAKGIHYLHTGFSGPIIHRDIKSTNILLDEHYVAKVADFGLSRLGLADQTHVSTDVKGSFGYFDPDYFRCSLLTQKSDVYSFGVVLLEVLCARPVINHLLPGEQVNLAEWALSWQRKGEIDKIADPLLMGKINPNSLRKFGETVEKCLRDYGVDRPNMVDVLWDLEYTLQLQHSASANAPHEDSTMDISMGLQMNVLQRFPSMPTDDDELHQSISFSDASQVNATDAFSQLKIDHEDR